MCTKLRLKHPNILNISPNYMSEDENQSVPQPVSQTEPETVTKKVHSAEQRGATRYPAQGEFTLILDGGEVIHKGQLKDVSDSGVFVKMGTPPAESCVYKNGEMKLISQVDGKALEIVGDVRVIRVTSRGVGLYINAIEKSARMDFVKLMISVRYNKS